MSKFRASLKVLIPLLLAITILWLVLSKIDLQKLLAQISSANPRWVLLAIAISLLSHLSRAYRWNILLEPLHFKPKLSTTFAAVMVGYFGNIFLPRGGEVMRCLVLTRIDKVPFNASFGTVVAERAFDFLCLLILMALALLLEFKKFKDFFYDVIFHKKGGSNNPEYWNNPYLIGAAIIILIGIIVLFLFRKQILGSPFLKKIIDFALGIWEGVVSVKNSERKAAFLLHTFLIWAGYFLMTYLMFFSLEATSNLGLIAGLVILIVGGLGMSAPVSGGIGPFHYLVATALTLFYSIQQEEGIAYAFVIHTSQLISILVVGGISSIWVLIAQRRKNNEPELTN